MIELLDLRMANGSRQFARFPESAGPDWYRLRDRVERLPGAVMLDFVTDEVVEAWIEFKFSGHVISLNNQLGEWWFFVEAPACPDRILLEVLRHFAVGPVTA